MIAVVGLGLIGGSVAKAISRNTDHVVYGYDKDDAVEKKAIMVNAVEGHLNDRILSQCEMTFIALYPEDTVRFIEEKASVFAKGSIVIDCCGVKRDVCSRAEKIAEKNGFTFLGAHPMAGLEHAGFEYATRSLFNNASMVLTPARGTAIEDVEKVKDICLRMGFSNVEISTPEEHDRLIAFTSQLAHIVSSAYIKSPSAEGHMGFSAGSYKDMTRVAKLNEDMWTELFLKNRDNLLTEIDALMGQLEKYRTALKDGDREGLHRLLREGREKKELIDKEQF